VQDCSQDRPYLPALFGSAEGDDRMTVRWSRLEQAEKLQQAHELRASQQTQQAVAAELGVARSTLREWESASKKGGASAAMRAFFHSPEGIECLHQVVVAAHFVITLLGASGVRRVCQFLELSGLAEFVAPSYGSQQALNVALEEAVVNYARAQRLQLGPAMPAREVTVVKDETYHPAICLVALEPVSNFILLEQYADNRSAATWGAALTAATENLPIRINQGVSDEANGLLRVQRDLGAHHSPDLFHVQHEVAKATSLNLARQTEQAAEAVAAAQTELEAQQQAQATYQAERPRGRPPAFAHRIEQAGAGLQEAHAEHARAQDRQAMARKVIAELSAAYHPYELPSGEAQPPERVAQRFTDAWQRLDELVEAADLPARARRQVAKAKRVTPQMVATLSFFFATLHARIEALNLAPAIETALLDHLVPAIYLDRVAKRGATAEQRVQLQAVRDRLLSPLHRPEHPLNQLPAEQRQALEQLACECADLFQRSSSCVEGRNGQLSLHHHGRHRLSDRKLEALTAVHNYFLLRPDGTTAAERFFGQAPTSLFSELLQRIPLPPKPAEKRPRPRPQSYLLPLAA